MVGGRASRTRPSESYRSTIQYPSDARQDAGQPQRLAPDYWTLAELRYHIRRFLRVREEAARAAGIEPQQYLVLLQIKGMQGRALPTVGVLAERLQLRHHSTVELIDRLVDRGMLVRRSGGRDRREVLVELRPAGETILKRLARYSLTELKTEGPALVSTLRRLIDTSKASRRQTGRAALPRGVRRERQHGVMRRANGRPRAVP